MKTKKRVLIMMMLIVLAIFSGIGGYNYGQYRCKPYVAKQAVVKVKSKPVKKTTKKVVESLIPPVLAPDLTLIPALVSAPQKIILRLNVVEWSKDFEGRSPASSDIGPVIRKGLVEGTVRRSAAPITFSVNGAIVTVQGGQAVLDPGPIGPETAVSVRPLGAEKFVLPPGAQFPLTVGPEELDFLVKTGAKEIWLNFLLAPR